jgi:hypothetical protein
MKYHICNSQRDTNFSLRLSRHGDTAAGFDMSAGEKVTRTLKSAAIFAGTSATSSGLPKPLRTISEPAAAKARAVPKPIPLVEPVTSDTLPNAYWLLI